MPVIHYICSYSKEGGDRRIVTQPSSVSKISYIKSALRRAGYTVSLLSLAEGDPKPPFFFYKSLRLRTEYGETLRFISTLCRSNAFFKLLSRLWMFLQLLYYLFCKIGRDDFILVYHSLVYMLPIKIFRLFSRKKIYFEVEELYYAAYASSEHQIEKEKEFLRKKAAGYLVVNDLVSKLADFKMKSVVCYGVYSRVNVKKSSFNDGKIHLVYAGVIGNEDALLAVDICQYLTSQYYMHILGYGLSETAISELENKISEVNTQCGFRIVSYDGCLLGDDYYSFLAKCDIGLCTRVLNDDLSNYTFPSKVLGYISNGLLPLSSPLTCIKKSKIANKVLFSEGVTPHDFAVSIMSCDKKLNNYDNSFLLALDSCFVQELRQLFTH